jgi:hydroxyethylthiazole kinase
VPEGAERRSANPSNLIRVMPAEESWTMTTPDPPVGLADPPATHDVLSAAITRTLEALRVRRPRIHTITSPVAQGLTANGLLALGAVPSLTVNLPELEAFILSAEAVLLNLGMLDPERLEALPLAARIAAAGEKPFVLDPVFAERSAPRRALARTVLAPGPQIVKLNTAEAEAFARDIPPGTVTVVTGAIDRITRGGRTIRLANGHPLLARVTATGCLLGAILAACLAVEEDALRAAIAGVSLLNIAAEVAAEGAAGPGSFACRLIDALAGLEAETIHRRLRIEVTHDVAP